LGEYLGSTSSPETQYTFSDSQQQTFKNKCVTSVKIRYKQRTDYSVKRHKSDHKILFTKQD